MTGPVGEDKGEEKKTNICYISEGIRSCLSRYAIIFPHKWLLNCRGGTKSNDLLKLTEGEDKCVWLWFQREDKSCTCITTRALGGAVTTASRFSTAAVNCLCPLLKNFLNAFSEGQNENTHFLGSSKFCIFSIFFFSSLMRAQENGSGSLRSRVRACWDDGDAQKTKISTVRTFSWSAAGIDALRVFHFFLYQIRREGYR